MTTDFYNHTAQMAREIAAQVVAETNGMSDTDLKAYELRGAREHLAALKKLKAGPILIEQAELRVARIANELSALARDTRNQEQAGSSD